MTLEAGIPYRGKVSLSIECQILKMKKILIEMNIHPYKRYCIGFSKYLYR